MCTYANEKKIEIYITIYGAMVHTNNILIVLLRHSKSDFVYYLMFARGFQIDLHTFTHWLREEEKKRLGWFGSSPRIKCCVKRNVYGVKDLIEEQ